MLLYFCFSCSIISITESFFFSPKIDFCERGLVVNGCHFFKWDRVNKLDYSAEKQTLHLQIKGWLGRLKYTCTDCDEAKYEAIVAAVNSAE